MTRRRRFVPILAYHRVGEPKGDHVPTVTPEAFERQLAIIKQLGFQVRDFGEVVEALERRIEIDRRTIAITFDDGYEETYTLAAPLLHRFGFPATVFITPMEVGTAGFMSWDQVHGIIELGCTIGSHTLHHTYLPLVSHERAREELVESKRILEARLGRPAPWLSYPVGGYTVDIQALAKAAGYEAACTTNRGTTKDNLDLFAIRRIKMTERDRSALLIWAKLSGYYNAFRRLEPPS